jgi:DNA repair exonuclease SbcCD nuclease subunit
MTRFIHTSDWQLGMTRHFLREEAQARFTQDRIDAIRKIGALAEEHAAEFVVVAGDIFESNQVAPQTILRALEALGTIPVPVLLLPANHDPLDSASVYRSRAFNERKPDNVTVIESSEPLAVPAGRGSKGDEVLEGIEIVGVPWHSKRQVGDQVAEVLEGQEQPAAGTTRVMVAHGIVDVLSPDAEATDLIGLAAAEAAIREGRIHYLALGDRHSATDVGETRAVWYSGSHVATDFRDQDPGNVLLIEIGDGSPLSVEKLPVDEAGAWTFVDQTFDLAGAEDVDAVESFLGEQPDKARTIVRLALTGQLSITAMARLDEVLDEYGDLFASLREWERHTDLAVLPDELDAESLALAGYARTTWNELAEQAAGSGDGARVAADALALLFRFARADHDEATAARGASS